MVCHVTQGHCRVPVPAAGRRQRTRRGRRALGCFKRAVPVIRWFLDGTCVAQLACDNELSDKTCYRYLHEGTDLLAAHALGLRHALAQAKPA